MNFLLLPSFFRINILTIKLRVIFCLLCISQVVFAQTDVLQKPVSIDLGETTLGEAFHALEKEIGYRLLYSPSLIKPDQKLQVSFKQRPVEDILKSMLGDKLAGIQVEGNMIKLQPGRGSGGIEGSVQTLDQKPVPYATIALDGKDMVQTDAQGKFSLTGLGHGQHVLVVHYLGRQMYQQRIEVLGDRRTGVNITVEQNEQELETVEVTGLKRKTSSVTKSNVPLENLPMMVQIIDQSLMQQRQVTSIREVITSVSGINYNSSFAGGYDTFTGRGFGLNVMRNGIAVSNTAGPLYGDNIEQIDVLKGPASIQYGDIAPGSVMNLVTKKPLDYDYKRFEMKLGENGLLRPTLDVSGPLNTSKTLLFRLNSSLEKSNSFRDEINNQTFLFAPTITWKITPQLTWNVEGVYNNDNRTADPGIISPDNTYEGLSRLRFDTFLGEPANVYRSTDENLFSTLEYQLSTNWKIRNVTYYTKATRGYGWISFNLNSLSDSGYVDRNYSTETGKYGGWGTTVDFLGTINWGVSRHHVLVGGEYLYDDRDRSLSGWGTLDKPINLYDPVYGQSTLIIDNQGTPGDPSSNRKRLGFYLQDQIALLQDRLQLLLGVRMNHIERASTWSTGTVPDVYKPDEQTIFNPRFGVLVKPTNWLSVFSSYTNSFEMNGQNRFTGELIDPADAHQYEAGVKTNLLQDRLGLTLAAFKIDKKNISGYVTGLTAPPTFEHTHYSPESGTASYSGANHQSKGLELDINGRIIPELFVNAAFSYIDAEIVDDPAYPSGNQLGGSPQVIANLWLNYSFSNTALKGFDLGGGYSFRSKNYATSYNRITERVPSYGTVDVALGYAYKNFFTRLNISNITNEKGYTYGMYGGYYPLWTRRAVLSIGFKI